MIQSFYSKFLITSIFKWFWHLCHLFYGVKYFGQGVYYIPITQNIKFVKDDQ